MLRIRKMTEEDLDQVAGIAADLFALPWSRQGFQEALPMDNACFLVAEDAGRIAGYCGLFMAFDEGEVINIAVRRDCQRQGIANRLFQALLDAGRQNGISRFFLEVRVSNEAAIRLYEKNGFSRQGIRRDFYKMPREDAYVMSRIEEI